MEIEQYSVQVKKRMTGFNSWHIAAEVQKKKPPKKKEREKNTAYRISLGIPFV